MKYVLIIVLVFGVAVILRTCHTELGYFGSVIHDEKHWDLKDGSVDVDIYVWKSGEIIGSYHGSAKVKEYDSVHRKALESCKALLNQ